MSRGGSPADRAGADAGSVLTGIRVPLAAAGAGVMAFGLWGMLHEPFIDRPSGVALWLAAGVAVHDALLAPAVLSAGFLLARILPGWARGIVQGGLLVAAVTVLVTVPALLRRDASSNPSLLPLDYPRNLLIVVALIAAVTALGVLVRALGRRPR